MASTIPDNLLNIFIALSGHGNSFNIIYDKTGAILAMTGFPKDPSDDEKKIIDGAKVWDIIRAPYGDRPGPLPKERYFDPALSLGPVRMDASDSPLFRFYPLDHGYSNGTPCRITLFPHGGLFLAVLVRNSYFRERALGAVTQDMMIFLDNDDQVTVCTDLFYRIVPSHEFQKGTQKMEELVDARSWHALIDREKNALEYIARCEREARLTPWIEAPAPPAFDGKGWIMDADESWDLLGLETGVRTTANSNRFLTSTRAYPQDGDIRITFEFVGAEFNGVGVCFQVNIYKAQIEFGFPDADGYNFQVLRAGPDAFRLKLKKFSNIVHDLPLPLGRLVRERKWDWTRMKFTFEKSGGGLFILYLNDEKIASLCDTAPILNSPNHFISLLGNRKTRIRGLGIFTRPSVFEPYRLPPEAVDLTFYRLPGRIFEARVGYYESGYSSHPLKYVYMKDVTHSRDLLAKVNHYVKEIDEDLNTAKRIQAQLTRLTLPENPRIRFSCLYRPSGKVGGDMLDIRDLGNNRYAALIYDVAGHGVAASLISAMAKMSFDTAFKQDSSPARVMAAVNRDLCSVTDPSMFVTAFLCVLDLDRMTLTYSRAGHCIPALFPPAGGAPRLLDKGGPVLGNSPAFTFEEYTAPLLPGERGLLYTDGIIEVRNRNDDFFERKRLFDLARATLDLLPADAQARILAAALEFNGNEKFEDDVALIFFDILPVK